MQNEEISYKAQKRKVLIVLGGVQVVATLAAFLLNRFEPAAALISIFSAVGWAVGILAWVKIDAEERGEEVSSGFRIALVIFGFFALCYYLFKTRGLAGGFKSIGWALLYALAFFATYFVLVLIVVTILVVAGVPVE